jgi:hypothetical protein
VHSDVIAVRSIASITCNRNPLLDSPTGNGERAAAIRK